MRKFGRKIKFILLIICIIAILFGLKKGSFNLSNMLDTFEDTAVVRHKVNTTVEQLVEKVFGKTDTDTSSSDLIPVSYVRAVDGDTILVTLDGVEEKVRMIGIDTPESVHADETKNTVYGEKASEFTKNYLSGYKTLYLQYDEEKRDQYGRILAYVWLNNDVDTDDKQNVEESMFNAILLKNGYALNKKYPPNTAYADMFEEIRCDAESSKAGLWADNNFTCFIYE